MGRCKAKTASSLSLTINKVAKSSVRELVCTEVAYQYQLGARCSSVVRAFAVAAMGRRIDPSWGGPIELFLVPACACACNKCRGMCYPVCGMMHIKEPLLLIGKSSPCGGSRFRNLSGPLPYVLRHITVNKMC